eukprot:gene454-599_t
MAGNFMPQWFHRSTFANVRKFIMTQLNCSTFDEAWDKWAWGPLSPVNIIGNYALRFEAHLYRQAFQNDTDNTLITGWHLPPFPREFHEIGCCRTFNVSCTEDALNDTTHLIAPK